MNPINAPRILTTTVGSYPVPDWLAALPSEQALLDATRVVFNLQRQAGIDLPTDGELYRFDVNHPETNGMIEHFLRSLSGLRTEWSCRFVTRAKHENTCESGYDRLGLRGMKADCSWSGEPATESGLDIAPNP